MFRAIIRIFMYHTVSRYALSIPATYPAHKMPLHLTKYKTLGDLYRSYGHLVDNKAGSLNTPFCLIPNTLTKACQVCTFHIRSSIKISEI